MAIGGPQLQPKDFSSLSALTTLALHDDSATSVPDAIFGQVPTLTTLSLYRNDWQSLRAEVFDGLNDLTVLHLHDNRSLGSLPEGVFGNLTSLTELSLSNNGLTSLPIGIFDYLVALTKLRLDENGLTSLHVDVFHRLVKLTRLNLVNNSLTVMPDGVFQGLHNLEELYLDGNEFSPGETAGPLALVVELGESDLLAGFVAKVKEGAPFDITVNLTATGGALSKDSVVIPAGHVTSPAVGVKDFQAVSATVTATGAAFPSDLPAENYSGLSVASGGPSASVTVDRPDPPTVALIGGSESVLEGEAAEYSVRVEGLSVWDSLSVAYSLGVDELDETNDAEVSDPTGKHEPHEASDFTRGPTVTVPIGLPDGWLLAEDFVGTFSVQTEPDDVIDDGTRETFVVRLVESSGYEIADDESPQRTILWEGICDRTQQVQQAVLDADELIGRNLTDCWQVTDADLASLHSSFELKDKGIVSLKHRDLIDMTELQSLCLIDNQLLDIPDGLFQDQSKMKLLDLQGNQLSNMRSGMWTGLTSVIALSLSYNNLGAATWPADGLSGMPELETLWLNHNGIATLPSGVFGGLPSLANVFLDNNEMVILPDGVFSGSTNLDDVGVRYNPGSNYGAIFVVKAKLEAVEGGVRVFVPKAAPFNTTVTLSATPGGTLSSTVVTVEAGQFYSGRVTVDTTGGAVSVSVESVSWTGSGTATGMKTGKGGPIVINP